MFDNTKYNVIILADATETHYMSKTVGPYALANRLRKHGVETAVLHHLHVFGVDEIKDILSKIISSKTLFVGVSNFFYVMMNQRMSWTENPQVYTKYSNDGGAILPHGVEFNQEIKDVIKSANPDCRLVLGGPMAKEYDYIKDFDYVVMGYADNSIVNLAQHLVDKKIPLNKSRRSIYGPIIINDSVAEGFDFPGNLLEYQSHDCILPEETLPIEIGRGCIFRCSFCSYPLNGKNKLDHIKKEELLLQEFLNNYHRFGVTRYVFSDDTFNDSLEKVDMIWRISKKLPFKLEYWAYVRLDLLAAHPSSIDKLFQSGLRSFFFGIETMNKTTGSIIGKGGDRKKLIQTLHHIKSTYGNEVMLHGSFIIGLPKEDIVSIQKTLDFLMSPDCPLDSFKVKPLGIRRMTKDQKFNSPIELEPEKYGYIETEEDSKNYNFIMNWKNEYLTYEKSVQLANDFRDLCREKDISKLIGFYTFNLSGLGFDLSFSRNKKISEIDWEKVSQQKIKRAKMYKDLVYQNIVNNK